MAASSSSISSGFPIGIFDDATYDEWSVKLNTGDILVFYSDGITEASNREGKFFGTQPTEGSCWRRTPHFHRPSWPTACSRKCRNSREGGAITDDRTLVVMKVK